MKSVFVLCTLLFGFVVGYYPVSPALVLLQGAWSGSVRNADFAVLIPDGVGTVCRDAIPPECEVEVPNGSVTYTINGTNISQVYTHLPGITTREAAAELMPSCAAAEIYPTEFGLQIPPSEISSYNIKTRRLVYVDPRRPDEETCLLIDYRFMNQEPSLYMEQRISFSGTLEEVLMNGPSYSCDGPPPECTVEVNEETGQIDLGFYNTLDLECTGGACLLL